MKMGELYREMGFINSGHTVQATRADLVGQYIGHTGPKTKEMITRSFGGILFIDEAYGELLHTQTHTHPHTSTLNYTQIYIHKHSLSLSLIHIHTGLYKEDSRDYGSEVIEMLVKFMDNTENRDFVVVLAGYRNLMTRMLNANLNLMSRMGNWIDFPDYDNQELLEISQLLAKTYGYQYTPDAQGRFTEFMTTRKEFPYFSNARTVRNCMERARRIAATRILNDALDNGTKYTMEQIQTFLPSDFDLMINEIKDLPRDTMLP